MTDTKFTSGHYDDATMGGMIYGGPFPFIRVTDTVLDQHGKLVAEKFWRPGAEQDHDNSGWRSETFYCDAHGAVEYEVLAICALPGRLQDRVLFRATYIDPEGNRTGGRIVKCLTLSGFNRRRDGWSVDDWDSHRFDDPIAPYIKARGEA